MLEEDSMHVWYAYHNNCVRGKLRTTRLMTVSSSLICFVLFSTDDACLLGPNNLLMHFFLTNY
jgi:hypothetical protein